MSWTQTGTNHDGMTLPDNVQTILITFPVGLARVNIFGTHNPGEPVVLIADHDCGIRFTDPTIFGTDYVDLKKEVSRELPVQKEGVETFFEVLTGGQSAHGEQVLTRLAH